MSMKISDQPLPQYIVVIAHDEYEQSVYLFISEEEARKQLDAWDVNDKYLAKIIY